MNFWYSTCIGMANKLINYYLGYIGIRYLFSDISKLLISHFLAFAIYVYIHHYHIYGLVQERCNSIVNTLTYQIMYHCRLCQWGRGVLPSSSPCQSGADVLWNCIWLRVCWCIWQRKRGFKGKIGRLLTHRFLGYLCQSHGCWCLSSLHNQAIRNHRIVQSEQIGFGLIA